MHRRTLLTAAAALFAALLLPASSASPARAEPTKLKVLTTTTDLRELAKEVGGEDAEVTCLMKGPEDPHFLEARPSFVRAAAAADALVVTGLELEVGYEPLLLGDSRNEKIQPGRPGHVDCSKGIGPLDVPSGPVDRSQGDVHPGGNPHYLTDPVRAKIAAGTITDALAAIAPDRAEAFRKRLDGFRRRVDTAMFGETILAAQPAERLERRLREGTLATFLKDRGLEGQLGGHAAALVPLSGGKVVSYHATFRYLLDRFHLEEAAMLEPKPGVPPTPKHLATVVERMKSDGLRAVLYTSFQPERTAQSVAAEAGGAAVRMAHQPDSVPGTATYLDMLAFNVKSLVQALGAEAKGAKR
jgi:zinc/manganese transport system substrate-binding protein